MNMKEAQGWQSDDSVYPLLIKCQSTVNRELNIKIFCQKKEKKHIHVFGAAITK